MAKSLTNFTDSLVIIRDNGNNLITETIVTGYNRDEMYIEVTEGMENVKPGARLRLLIIHPDGVSEFSGTLKYSRQGIYEIPIFGEQTRGARATARYPLNADALIKEMVVNSEKVSLRDPIQVSLENISKSGIFIKSPEIRFINDVVLWIEFNVKGKEMVLNAKVVREQKNNDNSYSYGCQLVFKSGEK
ncbi:MAG: PilZ domain-containing protein [Oscillospiraceae bacterium]|nr:PilZ domain-containing protein [Oscillospiraceae bacterium]